MWWLQAGQRLILVTPELTGSLLPGITGSRADVVKIRPPLTFSTQHADLLLEALNEALREH